MSANNVLSAKPTVDYLTCTTKSDKATAEMLGHLVEQLGIKALEENRRRRWQFMGYHGYSIEGARYGIRGSEGICILTGSTAAQMWHTIAPRADKCTRIDLAVTVTLRERVEAIAKEAYDGVLDVGSVVGSYFVNSYGGTTCYVGSRHSMFFGRIYDKGAEQGEESCIRWRYELECKKPASGLVLEQLFRTEEPGVWIADYVYQWFASRGVKPLYNPTNAERAIEVAAKVSTLDKALQWLTTQVRPTVGRLIIAGREQEARDALGLPKQDKFPW